METAATYLTKGDRLGEVLAKIGLLGRWLGVCFLLNRESEAAIAPG